jgi:hypothetical protein
MKICHFRWSWMLSSIIQLRVMRKAQYYPLGG